MFRAKKNSQAIQCLCEEIKESFVRRGIIRSAAQQSAPFSVFLFYGHALEEMMEISAMQVFFLSILIGYGMETDQKQPIDEESSGDHRRMKNINEITLADIITREKLE